MSDGTRRVSKERVLSVERALMLLQCYSRADERRSLTALARRSGFYKSTTLRLAGSLCRMGFLRREADGLYSLGAELRRLASLANKSEQLGAASREAIDSLRPVIRSLAARTLETASFYVRDGQSRICLVRENSPREVRHHVEEGRRASLRVGAGSKVIRAFSKHVRDPALRSIRARGWALSLGEKDPDLAGISVPVFNKDKELLGALTISAVRSRFSMERQQFARDALIDAAKYLSRRLGDFGAHDLVPTGTSHQRSRVSERRADRG